MSTWEVVHSTPLFTIERARPELYLVRYREGIVINAALIEESLRVRRELAGYRPYASIAVFPSSALYEPDLYDNDLYEQEDPKHFVKALAIVNEGGALIPVAERYYAKHPPFFKVKIFDNIPDALVWVEGVLSSRN